MTMRVSTPSLGVGGLRTAEATLGFGGVQNVVSGGAPSYTRTAFISNAGNDGTAVLNDVSHPFLTIDAASVALAALGAGATTMRILSDLTDDMTDIPHMDLLYTRGLTIRSHDGTIWTLSGALSLGTVNNSILSLNSVTISSLTKPSPPGSSAAATITGDANTTIALLTLDYVGSPDPGNNGSDGASGTGTPDNPSKPADNSPPTPGTNGGNFNGDAPNDGSAGSSDRGAWNTTTLLGNLTVSSILGRGVDGGNGGTGGNGGAAQGGAGGEGGDSNAIVLEDGAPGGNGGNATANGRNGYAGGNGGDGANIFKAAGVTITASNLVRGIAGSGGAGGSAGNATGGVGGLGGQGAIGGSQGATGTTGTQTATGGIPGANGQNGFSGTIIPI